MEVPGGVGGGEEAQNMAVKTKTIKYLPAADVL